MVNSKWNAYVRWEPMYAGHLFNLVHEDLNGKSLVTSFNMKKLERHGGVVPPDQQPIPMDQVEDFLRTCMDAAWELGIRPTGFKDHTNELTAVRYHLEDMRAIAKVPMVMKEKDSA